MNTTNDHPDIEKLPLEIDGIPVRETIREIFRNPVNGTPDNISKTGCLELAFRSNDVGGRDRGYVVWNEWAKLNPNIFRFRSCVDFSGIDFQLASPNFSNFIFGGHANFENTQFGNDAKFQAAEWGMLANFKNAKFGKHANFQGAMWDNNADFKYAQFGDFACFQGARWGTQPIFLGVQWGRYSDFTGAQWGYQPTFSGAQWGEFANFSFARWGSGARFQGARLASIANFQGTYWAPYAHFQSLPWSQVKSFYADVDRYQNARDYSDANNASPFELPELDFSGATFLGPVDFSGRQFKAKARFGFLPESVKRVSVIRDENGHVSFDENGNVIFEDDKDQHRHTSFGAAPIFHGCELHQDTSFEGAKFPDPTGTEEATRAYRTLKLAFSKQQAIREEQRFFRLEMEEETLREKGWKRWLFKSYKQFSDFGFSVTLPLKFGCMGLMALTVVYGLLSWLGQCGLSVQACHFAPEWLEFSMLQTLPLPGLDKLSEATREKFWPEGAWWGLGLSALVIAHKTISLASLFLIGLALRNLFKLK